MNTSVLKKKIKSVKIISFKTINQSIEILIWFQLFQVHGDVFRAPASPMFFSILVGTGYHIATVAFFVILLAIMDDLYTGRGIQYN